MPVTCPHCLSTLDDAELTRGVDVVCPGCGSIINLSGLDTVSWPTEERRQLGRFELVEELGAGGFGTVYKAQDSQLGRLVAIKIPHGRRLVNQADITRFLREARSAAALRHPGIVSVYDVTQIDGSYCLVSEFVRGVTLADRLTAGRLPFGEAAAMIAAVAEALHHAHEQGVIHRDIKPANIMIDDAGQPHLMDFGLAKHEVEDVTLTHDGQVLGTPAYMSPEQALGNVHQSDRRTDIYSLGVVLYELLTGQLPFRGNARMLIAQVVDREPTAPRRLDASIPHDLETVCLKAMAKDPGRRYPTAAELAADLKRYLHGEPIHARPVSTAERLVRWARRNPAIASLLAAVATLLLGIAVVSTVAFVRTSQALEEKSKYAEQVRQQRDRANKYLYLSNMRLAQRSQAAGNSQQVRDILAQHVPTDDRPDHRRWEWYFLQREAGREVIQLHADHPHADGALAVAWHPLGRALFTANGDHTVRQWDVFQATELGSLASHQEQIYALAISPNGKYLASGSVDGELKIWSIEHAKVLHSFQAHADWIRSLAFNSQSDQLASAGFDQRVRFWNPDTAERLGERQYFAGINGIAWSPDDRFLAAGTEDHRVLVWNLHRDEEPLILAGHDSFVQSVAWNPEGNLLASASWDQTIRIWELPEGKEKTTLRGHTDRVHSVGWGPASSQLASGSFDGTVRVWNVEAAIPKLLLRGDTGNVHHMSWSPDGQRIAVAGLESTFVWDTSDLLNLIKVRNHSGWAHAVSWHHDSQRLASAGQDRTVRVWTPADPYGSTVLHEGQAPIWSAQWHPQQDLLALADAEGNVRVLRGDTGEPAEQWQFDPVEEPSICWSPNGDRLCVSSQGGKLTICELGHEKSRREIVLPIETTYSIAWSPDGQWIAVAGSDNRARIVDVASGKIHATLQGHSNWVYSLAWSPQSDQLATTSYDRTINIWRIPDSKLMATLRGHTARVRAVAWSPDGQRLASGGWDQTVKLWDTETWQEVFVLRDHPIPGSFSLINALAWSPDGQKLASANEDGKVTIWNAGPHAESISNLSPPPVRLHARPAASSITAPAFK